MAMAENNSAHVGIGAAGKVYIAPAGTTVPTTASGTLDNAFQNVGYISDAGVVISETGDSQDIGSWGGQVVKTIKTTFKEVAKFTPIQVDATVIQAMYADVTVNTANGVTTITAKHNNADLPPVVVVIDCLPNDITKTRYIATNAQLTTRGDASLTGTAVQGRELEYTCNPGADGTTITSITEITEA